MQKKSLLNFLPVHNFCLQSVLKWNRNTLKKIEIIVHMRTYTQIFIYRLFIVCDIYGKRSVCTENRCF